jgi:hypothetical protein
MKRHLIAILLLLLVLTTGCGKKIGVLISTGETRNDDVMIHSEYWYDTVIMYDMLQSYGYDEIYVLYGNGTDFASVTHPTCYNATTRFGGPITDLATNRANIQAIFAALSSGGTVGGVTVDAVTDRDRLFVWWMGHGGGSDMCDYSLLIESAGETVTGMELARWIGQVSSYRDRSIHIMTCHAGCFTIPGNNTVEENSSLCSQGSASLTSDVVHAEYTNYLYSALRGNESGAPPSCLGSATSCDTDSNGMVSFGESFACITGSMTWSTPTQEEWPAGYAATSYAELP